VPCCHRVGTLLLAVCTASAAAGDIGGTWRYKSTVADAVYGEPEYLDLAIRVEGAKVCGNYLSAYRGGMRVAEGSFSGLLAHGEWIVTYEAGWAGVVGDGKASVRASGAKLSWKVVQPGPEPDYVIQSALLHRASTRIEPPSRCP
jgi:hypothetical protein